MSNKTNSGSNGSSSGDTKQKDKILDSIIKFSVVVVFIIIVYLIYKYFIVTNYQLLRIESFDTNAKPTIALPSIKNATPTNLIIYSNKTTNSIYESSLKELYSGNTRLLCGMLPNIGRGTNVCTVNNEPFVIYNFPIHMIKLIDGTILAVFNDGRLYQKQSMMSTIWTGPITNSLPNDIVPLRMITLATDLVTLLGVGYDNILYIKKPDVGRNINLTATWTQVPNNSSIIYVLFDNETNLMISIDNNGKLFIKTSLDITSNNQELVTKLDRPILRLYYDMNGYMMAIDTKFDLYQFTELNWKNTPLNLGRGANSSKIQDLLYDNDGKLYGLIFNPDAFMVQIMKQNAIFYLADFISLDMQLTPDIAAGSSSESTSSNFVLSDQDIIKCKIGSLNDYLISISADDSNDDDPNFAYQKQIIENQARLRSFCANRGVTTGGTNSDNYELLASVDKNNDKISQLKNIINNLMKYEPDNIKIKEKYPIIA